MTPGLEWCHLAEAAAASHGTPSGAPVMVIAARKVQVMSGDNNSGSSSRLHSYKEEILILNKI